MAVTFTATFNSVFGDKRVTGGELAMGDLVSGAVHIGLNRILMASVAPGSANVGTASHSVHINYNSAGSAVNGYIQIKSAGSADVFQVFAIGE